MNTLHQSLLLAVGALALAGSAYAQVPSTNDSSDSNGNTGSGKQALQNLAIGTVASAPAVGGIKPPAYDVGLYNSAFGYQALFSTTTGANNFGAGYVVLYSNTTGSGNTASGAAALYSNTTGSSNTAAGYQALYGSSGAAGSDNTGVGANALFSYSTGSYNTATGYQALYSNATGSSNTATGYNALYNNTTAGQNSAFGYNALTSNTTGSNNTASGYDALISNATGNDNSAFGYDALYSNTVGNYNNAFGYLALHNNSSGSQNSATGVQALYANKTGNFNTAAGTDALYSNTTGSTNIAVGYKAGYNLTTGSNNIDIGNVGVAAENATIRIGTTSTQTATYIAGIYGTSVTGAAVVVSSTGQLGVTVSSERFKTAIAPMGTDTAKLKQLRPVSFRLKSDATGTRQYGLIAEEVAKVYPELVLRDVSGRIDGVRYDELAPMLLNEMQQQLRRNDAQAEKIATLSEENAGQSVEIRALKRQMSELTASNQATQVALRKLLTGEKFVVQR
jgi:hypothetical protein